MYKSKFLRPAMDEGISIEEKVRKAASTNTPCESISPLIYTNAKDGVLPQFDIRTDRQELALDAIDHYQATELAKGDNRNIDNDKDLPSYVEPQTTDNDG